MNEKNKAKELFNKYYDLVDSNYTEEATRHTAKECANIAITEIIKTCEYNLAECHNTDWWNRVRTELNDL